MMSTLKEAAITQETYGTPKQTGFRNPFIF